MSWFFRQRLGEQSADSSSAVVKPIKSNTWGETARFAILALIIVLPIRFFVASPFLVSGASMDDTFHDGQYLIVDRVGYHFDEPKRGDVIIFRYPLERSTFFIKRIIGLPGDTVTISDSNVIITNDTHPDGLTLTEPYIESMRPTPDQNTTLNEGEYFVMGDNRDHSSDSRAWGALPGDHIVGRAWLRLFPPATAGFFPGATTFNSDVTE